MNVVDRILAALALAGFAAFLGVMAWFVPSPPLLAVFAIVLAMAAYDLLFASGVRQRRAARRDTT